MALTAAQVTKNYQNYVASQPKTSTTSSSSAPAGSAGATYRNASGQLINSAGQVVGGAITSGGISYGSGIVPGGAGYTEKAGGAIPASNIGAVAPVALPGVQKPSVDYSNFAQALATQYGQGGITEERKTDSSTQGLMDIFNLQTQLTPKPESKTELYTKTYGLTPEQTLAKQQAAEARVSTLSAKLAGINQGAQARLLSLRNVAAAEGVTDTVYGAQQTRINTDAAIEALPVAAELSAAQGDLARADKHLDDLFKVQSADIDADYEYRKSLVDSFVQFASKAEQRKYDAILQEAADRKAEYKENAKTINDWASSVAQYEPELISTFTSISPKDPLFNEKLALAQSKIKSPMAKLEMDIKKAQLDKLNKEIALLGVKTPKELKEDADKLRQVEARASALKDKVNTTNAILNSKAIDSVVGTSFLSRAQQGLWGRVKQVGATTATGAVTGAGAGATVGGVGAIPGAIIGAGGGLITGTGLALQGVKDELTGDRQALIGSVNQIVNQEFLDAVLELKSQGGTLGQITNIEGDKLQQAATRIGTWEIRDKNNKVIGYNVSEAEFKKEIEALQTSYNKILQAAQGTVLDSEEEALLEIYYNAGQKALDPSSYFSN